MSGGKPILPVHEGDEAQPLVGGPYTNPYIDEEIPQDAINAGLGGEGNDDDNLSVADSTEGAEQIKQTREKAAEGKVRSLKENLETAKQVAGEPLAKNGADEDNNMGFAIFVVGTFLFADLGKYIFEPHNAFSINGSLFPIVASFLNIIVAIVGTLIVLGPSDAFSKMFDWEMSKGYILPSFMFSVSQLFNILQNSFLDPPTRKAFTNIRIILTAIMSTFVLGSRYTGLQWWLMASIMVSVIQFTYMKDADPEPISLDGPVVFGFILSLGSNFAAVLGSLLGEKHMKATKKLPFVLQKFHFEIWTLAASIVGLFSTNLLANWGTDLYKDGVWWRGKKFNEATGLFTGQIRTAGYMLANDKFFSVEPFTPMINGVADPHVLLPNKFDLRSWHVDDKRSDGAAGFEDLMVWSVPETNKGSTLEQKIRKSMVTNGLYSMIEGYAGVTSQLSGLQPVNEERGINSWWDRVYYLNGVGSPVAAGLKRQKDKSPSVIRKMQGNSYNMMFDVSSFGKALFEFKADKVVPSTLYESFSVQLGYETRIGSNTVFFPMKLFTRDRPSVPASVLERKIEKDDDGNVIADHGFKTGKPETLFTMHNKGLVPEEMKRLGFDFVGALNQLKASALGQPGGIQALFDKLEEKKEKTYSKNWKNYWYNNVGAVFEENEDVQNIQNAVTRILSSPDVVGKVQGAADALRQPRVATNLWTTTTTYKREMSSGVTQVECSGCGSSSVDVPDTSLTVTYIREVSASLKIQRMDNSNAIDTLKFSVSESADLPFTCAENLRSGDMETEEPECTPANVAARATTTSAMEYFNNAKRKGTKVSVILAEDFSEIKEKFRPKIEASMDAAASKPQMRDVGLFIATNDQNTNFAYSTEVSADTKVLSMKRYLDQMNQTGRFWTRLGKVPANACSKELCEIDQSDNELKARVGTENLYKFAESDIDPNRLINEDKREDLRNPYGFTLVHEYTYNPLPWVFISRGPWILALLSNMGQSWTSALVSKVLSSLMKNLLSAFAMAILVMLQLMFVNDGAKRNDTKWADAIIGGIGVIVTVLCFNFAPKAPKPEEGEKKEEGAKH